MSINDSLRNRILNPAPGTALARARDFGIDLSLLLEGITSTPERRLERAAQAQALARALHQIREDRGLGR